jgi:plasmid segregation protein ParM
MNTSNDFNVMAIDDGYGDVKYDSKGAPALVPSFITSFKEKPTSEFASSSDLQYIASEVDGKRYVVGDYAMKLDPNIRWVGGENKHADNRFPALLKTALGLMCTGKHEVLDFLMMNLPILYDTPERRTQLENLAKGTHQVSISRDGVNFVPKVVSVENVIIKKQPFGSLCDAILDDKGELTNPELAQGFNVLVDVGARTLNILTVEALEEQPELSIQTNDGMFTAYSQVGAYLEKELKAIIPDGKLPQIIKAREIKGKDISPLIDAAYENQANTIISVLDRVLINSWGQVTSVILTGGGADKQLLGEYLAKGIRNRANTLFMNRYATVRGLRKYGIFNARKTVKRSSGIRIQVGGNEYK